MSHITLDAPALYVRENCEIRPATFEETLAAARQGLSRRVRRGVAVLDSPYLLRDQVRVALGMLEHEVFCLALLDVRRRWIGMVELFRGTLDKANVYTREVVKETLSHNAAAVALVHNHPSGVAEPSSCDRLLTTHLRSALQLIDVCVVDHLIVAGDEIYSFAEHGLC